MIRAARSLLFAATAAVVLTVGSVGALRAQPKTELARSPAELCLLPAADERAKPVYPPEMYERKQSATVEAEFEFDAPDKSPGVKITNDESDLFAAAVKDYAKQLRVPCMSASGQPVKLRQSFAFVPNDGRKVAWTTPIDEADEARKESLRCLSKPPASLIRYPSGMEIAERQGTVLARMRFVRADRPPTYEVLSDGGHWSFGLAVAPYVKALRMPCMGVEPISVDFEFQFRMSGSENGHKFVLKDLPLLDFIRATKPVAPGSTYFDLTTMDCPFDVRLTFRQPFKPNQIQELEQDVPARHAFLDWLGEREFKLEPKLSAEVLGQQMTIHVPCGKIDL